MKGQTYVWTPQEVVKIFDRALQVEDFSQAAMLKYRYCPLVWMTGNICVYGYFAQTERFVTHFRHTSPQDLPPEFKARLLLLGVPT